MTNRIGVFEILCFNKNNKKTILKKFIAKQMIICVHSVYEFFM